MALGKAGADRQEMHERIREHSLLAWESVQEGKTNPLVDLISHDSHILHFLSQETIISLLDGSGYVGDAPKRAMKMYEKIQEAIKGKS